MSYHRVPEVLPLQNLHPTQDYDHTMPPNLPIPPRRNSGRVRPGMSSTRRRKLIISYGSDWLITIGLAAVFFALDKVTGYKREFSLEDTSLRHPYAEKERVPPWALYIICFVAPLVLQPIINLLTIRSWWDLHNGTLGLILGLALTGAITQITKITVGRPRPDVIARCIPVAGALDPPLGLSSASICTQTDTSIMIDGWRSFPSGHSSLSFAGLGFLSFYIAGKVHLFDKHGHTPKAWLSLTPLAGAALVAISRTMDYRHHWHDVLVGSLLGLLMSYFAYRQYYPSLASEYSHRPYSPRIGREDSEPFLPTHTHEPIARLAGENDNDVRVGRGAYQDRYSIDGSPENYSVPSRTVLKEEPAHMTDAWKERNPAEEYPNIQVP